MSPATREILRAVLELPEQERAELTEELLAVQTPPDELPFDPAWLEEIHRRSAEIDEGQVSLSSWADVKQRGRERIRGHGGG